MILLLLLVACAGGLSEPAATTLPSGQSGPHPTGPPPPGPPGPPPGGVSHDLPSPWTLDAILGPPSATGSWTGPAILGAVRTRMDLDRDGRVGESEYTRVAMPDRPWTWADADRDGDLSVNELAVLLQKQDPNQFHVPKGPPTPPTPPTPPAPRKTHGMNWMVAQTLQAEIHAVDPTIPLPSAAEIDAVDGRTLDAGAHLWRRYADASKKVGIAFPAGLLPAEPLPTVPLPTVPPTK